MRSPASGRNAGNVVSNERAEAECRDRFMVIFNFRYAHYFEFLGGRTSSKGRVKLRCRVCGHEFDKVGSFAQQDTNIFCPRCHVHRDDAITVPIDGYLVEHLTELYKRGMKASEIAAETGLQDRHIRKMLKDNGVEFDTSRYQRAAKAERDAQREKQRELLDDVKRSFGLIFEEMDRYTADKALKAATDRTRREFGRFGKTTEFIEQFAPTWATCQQCGKDYLFFPDAKRYGRKKAGQYCSSRCKVKHNKTNSNISHRLRKYGSADKPRDSITLDKVIERDHGICYICGCETSKADHYFVRGHFTIGNTYPTIDHVIPIARGGTHTWDNVRLACRQCNSTKRDRVA